MYFAGHSCLLLVISRYYFVCLSFVVDTPSLAMVGFFVTNTDVRYPQL